MLFCFDISNRFQTDAGYISGKNNESIDIEERYCVK